MPRPSGSINSRTLEFIQRFEVLAKQHIDPLELMFKIAAGTAPQPDDPSSSESTPAPRWNVTHQLTAAQVLLSYRYPKQKAVEVIDKTKADTVQISWLDAVGEPLESAVDMPEDMDLLSGGDGGSGAIH